MTSKVLVNSLSELEQTQDFTRRHIGPSESQTQVMLNEIGAESIDALIDEIVPSDIRLADLPNKGRIYILCFVVGRFYALESRILLKTFSHFHQSCKVLLKLFCSLI